MKLCSRCKVRKVLSHFYKRKTGSRSGEYYEKCKDCMKMRGRSYYHENKKRQLPLAIARTRKSRKKKKDYIIKIKNKPCKDCDKRYPHYVMDFDHVNSNVKIINVAHAVVNNWSLDRIIKEIEKCEVVCANCHRIRTFKDMPS